MKPNFREILINILSNGLGGVVTTAILFIFGKPLGSLNLDSSNLIWKIVASILYIIWVGWLIYIFRAKQPSQIDPKYLTSKYRPHHKILAGIGVFVGTAIFALFLVSKPPAAGRQISGQATDLARQTQEQSFSETLTAWAETQVVVAANTIPAVNPTETFEPTAPPITILPPSALAPTSTKVFEPTKFNPPAATNILPSNTSLPPTQTDLPITTNPVINTVLLSFDSLPSAQGWTYQNGETGIPDTEVFSVGDGTLHMDSINKGFSGFSYIRPTTIDHQLPFTLVARARVTNYGNQTNENPYGFDLSIYVGFEQFEIGVSPGRIIGGAGPDYQLLSSTLDVTQFHYYQIDGQAGRQYFNVYIDGDLYGSIMPAKTNVEQDALSFGDSTAGANAQVDITYYSFTQ